MLYKGPLKLSLIPNKFYKSYMRLLDGLKMILEVVAGPVNKSRSNGSWTRFVVSMLSTHPVSWLIEFHSAHESEEHE